MNRSAALRLVAFSLLAVGCAATLRPNAPYKENRAYLYGRFTIEGQSMTFGIRCRDGTVYKVDFSTRNQVQMIELVPSICQLDQIEYGPAGRLVSFRMLRNEILDPGGVYYVGDYRASGTYDVAFRVFYNEVRQTWRMDNMRDNYVRTTADMRRTFPRFASVATQDRVAH